MTLQCLACNQKLPNVKIQEIVTLNKGKKAINKNKSQGDPYVEISRQRF